MLHSVLAVVVGYLTMAILVMVTTALAVRFVLHQPLGALRSPQTHPLSPAYLAANVTGSGIAAVIGGGVTAALAAGHPVTHGAALACLMLLMAVLSLRQMGSAQPRWYRGVLVAVMPALAVGGAVLYAALIAAH